MVASAQVEDSQTDPATSIYLLIDMHDLIAARRDYDIRSRRIVTGVSGIPRIDLVVSSRRDVGAKPCRVANSQRGRDAIVRAETLTTKARKAPGAACRKASARSVVNGLLPSGLRDQLHVKGPVPIRPRVCVRRPWHFDVTDYVRAVHGNPIFKTNVTRQGCGRPVHCVRVPRRGDDTAIVFNPYRLRVIGPIARMISDVLFAHHLRNLSVT